MTFATIEEVKAANAAAGHFFFEPDTMRFFRSTVGKTVYGGRYFVTGERWGEEPRRYTVREALPNGHVETVGKFRGYVRRGDAVQAAKDLAGVVA